MKKINKMLTHETERKCVTTKSRKYRKYKKTIFGGWGVFAADCKFSADNPCITY